MCFKKIIQYALKVMQEIATKALRYRNKYLIINYLMLITQRFMTNYAFQGVGSALKFITALAIHL